MMGAIPARGPDAIPRISYAQNMEDILIDRVFKSKVGTFMDIGASHPIVDSNTYFFYERGWRGVNIEPTPRLHALFESDRPQDLNLGLAASDSPGELPFYEIPDCGGLSTLSAEIANRHRVQGLVVVEHKVPVVTIADLIEEHGLEPPDFVTIDVEGHEEAVLRGIPLSTWRPGLFVIESTLPNTNTPCHEAWEPILMEQGYVFAAFNGINRFYLRDDLADFADRLRLPVNAVDEFQRPESVHLRTIQEHFGRLRSILDEERAQTEQERTHFAQERIGWEWGRSQAEEVRLAWERDRASMEHERISWAQAHEAFAESRTAWEHERERLEQAQADSRWRQKELEHIRAVWDHERARFEEDREVWRVERDRAFQELVTTQRQLRPYRLIDRLGVVASSYRLARRLSGRQAS